MGTLNRALASLAVCALVAAPAACQDPLDEEGYQQIEIGDRIRVTGQIDHDFFDGRVLDARTVTSLDTQERP